jgi:hypothetical protein
MNGITNIIDKYMKSKSPKVEPWGTPEFTKYENERGADIRTKDCILNSYGTNQHN